MALIFHTLDVFTDRPFGGNPLAVFLEADGLSTETMASIARELNISETVFVLRPRLPGALCRIRIFTPGRELPFAGHPTIGTAILLTDLGLAPATKGSEVSFLLEEEAGPVPVTVRLVNGAPAFAQLTSNAPITGPPPPPLSVIAEMVCLTPSDIAGEIEAVSAGVPFVMVPVRDRRALGSARLDVGRWKTGLADFWATEVFLFSRDPEMPGSDIRARMFAPAMGVTEDPATGAAAAALAGYLGGRDPDRDGTLRWTIEQGFEMGRPSLLQIEAEKQSGLVVKVRVGGGAVRMSEGRFRDL